MKRYIKQLFLLSLITSLVACSSDDDGGVDTINVGGGNAVLATTSVGRLDTNGNLNIVIKTKAGVTAQKIEVYFNTAAAGAAIILGDKVADATIAADNLTATFPVSSLPDFNHFGADKNGTTGAFTLAFVTTYSDGAKTTVPYTLSVVKAINWKDAEGTTITTSGVASINYLDNTPGVNVIRYATFKRFAATTVESVVMQWKKNKAGTYSAGDASFPTTKGEIDLATVDYAGYGLHVNDTLYYKFTVKSGTQTDYIETAIPVLAQPFTVSHSGSVANVAETGYNLATGTTASPEIQFASPFGIAKAGSTAISFVKSDIAFDSNIHEAQEAFDAGTASSSLTGLNKGDIVVYKITRGTKVSYGILEVGTKSTIDGVDSIAFMYQEGVLVK